DRGRGRFAKSWGQAAAAAAEQSRRAVATTAYADGSIWRGLGSLTQRQLPAPTPVGTTVYEPAAACRTSWSPRPSTISPGRVFAPWVRKVHRPPSGWAITGPD